MKLKDYIDEVMSGVVLGTVVNFEVELYQDGTVADDMTGNKVSFTVIKDNANKPKQVAN